MRRTLIPAPAIVLCALTLSAQNGELAPLLKRLEKRYNGAKTIQVLFEQSYTAQGRPARAEKGELFLRKPGKMRWDYTTPAGKLFLSDGKWVYFYSPSANRVEKTRLKESEDFRAPLAFLLGKLDFGRDFTNYQSTRVDNGVNIIAFPKNNRLPYREVEFTVTPQAEITRLRVSGQDQSVVEFRFGAEKLNPALNDKLFKFQMPPGAQFVDATAAGDNTN